MVDVVYINDFIPNKDNFNYLMDKLDWVQRDNCPRKEYWDTTINQSYTYGSGRGIRTYEPNKRITRIEEIRQKIKSHFGIYYEGCFLNRYDTAKDHLGWHSDDDDGINHDFPIMVITLGGSREINWKEIGSKGNESISRKMLDGGSLFAMPAGMRQTHYHRIPKAGFECEPRISLTFRKLI